MIMKHEHKLKVAASRCARINTLPWNGTVDLVCTTGECTFRADNIRAKFGGPDRGIELDLRQLKDAGYEW